MRSLLLLLVLISSVACGQQAPQAPNPTQLAPEVPATPEAITTPVSTPIATPEATPLAQDPTASGTLMIFAAASTTDAVNELVTDFMEDTGIVVKTNFASSSLLAQQINAGAQVDLFLSANEKWMDAVAAEHTLPARTDLLGNSLVAIVPGDSQLTLATPAELVQAGITRLALGDTAAVPAGIYAKQALEKLGLWEGLKARVVSANDVREALTFVERGEAEAGIVYATDAAISDKVRIAFTFDPALTDPIVYPIARLTEGEASRELYTRFTSPQALEVFGKYGFTPAADAAELAPAAAAP